MALVLQVNIRIKPENVDAFMAKVVENGKAARSEPGCRAFEVLVDPEDKTKVMLFEIYDDQKAFETHQGARRSRSTSPKPCRCSPRANGSSGTRRSSYLRIGRRSSILSKRCQM